MEDSLDICLSVDTDVEDSLDICLSVPLLSSKYQIERSLH